MDFVKDDLTRLVALINEHNTAFLDNRTAINTETTQATNALSQSTMLWHHQLGHYHYAGIEKLAKQKLVTGLELKFKNTDHSQIYKPC